MIDFKIKGTKIPLIKNGINIRVVNWREQDDYVFRDVSDKSFFSFGETIFNNEPHILCDEKHYEGKDYYMIKLSDLNERFNNLETHEQIVEAYEIY